MPGLSGAQDTFYVGNMKGVGRIYQQTFIDTYAKVALAKLYDCKTPTTGADLINDRVVPFYDARGVKLCRVLTDRGTEYCGNPEHHEYELYLGKRVRSAIGLFGLVAIPNRHATAGGLISHSRVGRSQKGG